jgi:transcriptional regulator with XRE-family HTH domain
MNVRKAAAELIRAERKARKLKRRTVARAVGAVPSWLRKLESGKRPISLDDFLNLAREIGFDPVRAFGMLAQHHAEAVEPKSGKKVFEVRTGANEARSRKA